MTNRTSSTANVTWPSYNYPTLIWGSNVTGSEEVQLWYGPDRQRWKQIYTVTGTTETTYYVGGLIDLVFSGGTTNYRHYIYAGNEPIAVYSRTAASVNTMSYMLEDHQGGVSNIASKAGASDINESLSAFGLRRNPVTWSGAPAAADLNTIASLSRQGYTFQTWLGQSMGLNHMNGRVEDAILRRFLSPDPYIQDPSNAQHCNRYRYVFNNPLTYIDPTGSYCGGPPAIPVFTGPANDDDGLDLLPPIIVQAPCIPEPLTVPDPEALPSALPFLPPPTVNIPAPPTEAELTAQFRQCMGMSAAASGDSTAEDASTAADAAASLEAFTEALAKSNPNSLGQTVAPLAVPGAGVAAFAGAKFTSLAQTCGAAFGAPAPAGN
jgi:RHS repeat-associated protein